MALTPIDEIHALQIQAGTLGRKAGHAFEDRISQSINNIPYPVRFDHPLNQHIVTGDPAHMILHYICSIHQNNGVSQATALSTGALATSEKGREWLQVNGVTVRRCKSDLIVTVKLLDYREEMTIGISTKQCNTKNPTNAQLYFTTANGFSVLLRSNGINVSETAIHALRQFCGDRGYRPLDVKDTLENRQSDPRRYFWEEINADGRSEWEQILNTEQDSITKLLMQKAYLDDPFSPELLLHKTKRAETWGTTEVAIYSIDELIQHSREYGGFSLKPYSVRKGSYKDPIGVKHLAPRFGIVQMQRGGQAQHPEQLQFNLEAGYFYKISQDRPNMLRNASG